MGDTNVSKTRPVKEMTIRAERVFELLELANKTDYWLAVNADISTSTVNKWRNCGADPGMRNIEKVCLLFGITMEEFVTGGVMATHDPDPQEAEMMKMKMLSIQIVRHGLTDEASIYLEYLLDHLDRFGKD